MNKLNEILQKFSAEISEDLRNVDDTDDYFTGLRRGLLSCVDSPEVSVEDIEEALSSPTCTESLKFPYKRLNTPEEILDYLKSKSVKVETEEDHNKLMRLIEDKTDWVWGGAMEKPTEVSYSPEAFIVEFFNGLNLRNCVFSGMWRTFYDDKNALNKLIPLSGAMYLLKRLPNKGCTDTSEEPVQSPEDLLKGKCTIVTKEDFDEFYEALQACTGFDFYFDWTVLPKHRLFTKNGSGPKVVYFESNCDLEWDHIVDKNPYYEEIPLQEVMRILGVEKPSEGSMKSAQEIQEPSEKKESIPEDLSKTYEGLLKYLRSKAVQVANKDEYDNLMRLVEDKTDWIWGGTRDKPTSYPYPYASGLSSELEFYKDHYYSGLMFNPEDTNKFIPLEEAVKILSSLPSK